MHTVKEQFAPEVHRDIASFNTDNEFNRAINEEDIDFNIPGVPHSTVKQLHSASVRDLIQKIENHPNRHAVQSDLQQSQSFTWYEYQDPGKSVVVDDRSGQLDRLSPAGYSKSDYDRSWSSPQEWKSEVTAHDRSGKPDKTSWNAVQQICPHHGDALLDGNAHSVRYDRTM